MRDTRLLQPQYIHDTSLIHWQCIGICSKYIPDTFEIQSKYIIKVLLWDLTGTFHCRLCPVWPPTAAQYVRSGAWTVGAPSGCMPRSGFCCKAPNWACWNVHALPAKKHVWCCHAMAAPTPQEPYPWPADAKNWMP